MLEKVLLAVTVAACLGVLAGHLTRASALSDGMALVAVVSLLATLPRRAGRRGEQQGRALTPPGGCRAHPHAPGGHGGAPRGRERHTG